MLVVGGYYDGTNPITSVEIFDPTTEEWATGPSLAVARAEHVATLLPDARVLVAAGTISTADVELYDPFLNRWARKQGLSEQRLGGAAIALLPDGRAMIAGGDLGLRDPDKPAYDGTATTAVDVYNPMLDVWEVEDRPSQLPAARIHSRLTLLSDGKLLWLGGWDTDRHCYPPDSKAMVYDFANKAVGWTGTSGPNPPRVFSHIVALNDGTALTVGGTTPGQCPDVWSDVTTNDVQRYGATGWRTAARLNVPRSFHTVTRLLDGRVLVAGGFAGDRFTAAVEIYDPVTDQWTELPGALSKPRITHTATLLQDGRVLVVGGANTWRGESGYTAYGDAEIIEVGRREQ